MQDSRERKIVHIPTSRLAVILVETRWSRISASGPRPNDRSADKTAANLLIVIPRNKRDSLLKLGKNILRTIDIISTQRS